MASKIAEPVAKSANNLVTAALKSAREKSVMPGSEIPRSAPSATPVTMVDFWHLPVRIDLNHFKHKNPVRLEVQHRRGLRARLSILLRARGVHKVP